MGSYTRTHMCVYEYDTEWLAVNATGPSQIQLQTHLGRIKAKLKKEQYVHILVHAWVGSIV